MIQRGPRPPTIDEALEIIPAAIKAKVLVTSHGRL
jgi:hypothetical protein